MSGDVHVRCCEGVGVRLPRATHLVLSTVGPKSEAEEISSYTAACAVRVPGVDTDQLAIFFHTPVSDGNLLTTLLKTIRGQVVKNIGVNVDYLIPVAKETIPKTSIGKIQRSALRQRFMDGEFDAMLYRLGTLRSSTRLLPDWFYTRHWRRKEAETTGPLSGRFLVFLDHVGLGAALCQALEDLQLPCIRVERGEDFAHLGPGHYRMAPGNQEHYRGLLQTLRADHYRPDVIASLMPRSCPGHVILPCSLPPPRGPSGRAPMW